MILWNKRYRLEKEKTTISLQNSVLFSGGQQVSINASGFSGKDPYT